MKYQKSLLRQKATDGQVKIKNKSVWFGKFAFFGLLMGLGLLVSVRPVFAAVVINEVMPNPAGSDNKSDGEREWVEIYNDADASVSLSGWYLVDDKGNQKSLSGTGQLGGKAYIVYLVEGSQGWLNNDDDGDGVRLFNAVGEQQGPIVSFDEVPEGYSWGRWPDITGEWQVLSQATPGSANSGPRPSETPTPSPTLKPSPTEKPMATPTNSPTPASANSPSPTRSPTATAGPTRIPTVKKELTPEAGISGQVSGSEGEVLGEMATTPSPEPSPEATVAAESRQINWLAVGLVGGGAAMLLGAGWPMWKEMKKSQKHKLEIGKTEERKGYV